MDHLEESTSKDDVIQHQVPLSYKTLERFLEEGRRVNLNLNLYENDELTPEKILSEYNTQRKIFHWLFFTICVLSFGILIMIILSIFFVEIEKSKTPPERVAMIYMHYIGMTAAVIVGLPLGVLTYRMLPSTNLHTVNYIHTGIYVVVFCVYFMAFFVIIPYNSGISDKDMVYQFTTLHSCLGFLFTLLLVIETISGLLFFVKKLKPTLKLNDGLHRLIGEILLVIGIGIWLTGISRLSYYFPKERMKNRAYWNVIGILSLILSVLFFILIFNPRFRRRSRPNVDLIYENPKNDSESHESSTTLVSKGELFTGVKKKLMELEEKTSPDKIKS